MDDSERTVGFYELIAIDLGIVRINRLAWSDGVSYEIGVIDSSVGDVSGLTIEESGDPYGQYFGAILSVDEWQQLRDWCDAIVTELRGAQAH